MPWIGYCPPPGETRAHYEMPMLISERPEALEDAKAKRKYWQQFHDEMVAGQKACGRDNREAALWCKFEAAEAAKWLRGWKFVVEILECYYGDKGQKEYKSAHLNMSAPIAVYADRCLIFVCDTAMPWL